MAAASIGVSRGPLRVRGPVPRPQRFGRRFGRRDSDGRHLGPGHKPAGLHRRAKWAAQDGLSGRPWDGGNSYNSVRCVHRVNGSSNTDRGRSAQGLGVCVQGHMRSITMLVSSSSSLGSAERCPQAAAARLICRAVARTRPHPQCSAHIIHGPEKLIHPQYSAHARPLPSSCQAPSPRHFPRHGLPRPARGARAGTKGTPPLSSGREAGRPPLLSFSPPPPSPPSLEQDGGDSRAHKQTQFIYCRTRRAQATPRPRPRPPIHTRAQRPVTRGPGRRHRGTPAQHRAGRHAPQPTLRPALRAAQTACG